MKCIITQQVLQFYAAVTNDYSNEAVAINDLPGYLCTVWRDVNLK